MGVVASSQGAGTGIKLGNGDEKGSSTTGSKPMGAKAT
jgi:hypothetical protein